MSPDTLGGLDLADLVAWVAGAGAFLVVVLVWTAFLDGDPLGGRLKALERRRVALRDESVRTARRFDRPGARMGLIRRLAALVQLHHGKAAEAVAARLAEAGYRGKDALTLYLVAKSLTPMVSAGAMAGAIWGVHALNLEGAQAVAACLFAGLFGSMGCERALGWLAGRRQGIIRKALPDVFDLLVICAEAGLSLDAAFERVAREIAPASPALAEEIALTVVELGFLPDRARALQGLAERVPVPGVRALVATLSQTERYGTPLAQALRVLAAEMRNERMLRAEEKAARLPAVMTVPLILFILPPLFIVLIGPGILKIADTFSKM